MVAAVQRAPFTRPDRYTVLNDLDLTDLSIGGLLAEAFA
jgi:hypothetical protein